MSRPLFTILTLFPEALESYLDVGILGIARRKGLVEVRLYDFRDWTRDRHRTVDDRPFGGGPGMVLKPEPLAEAIEWIEEQHGPHRRLVLDPAGRPFKQADAAGLAQGERCLLICGRYEGLDERLHEEFKLEPFSIGDFVLAGGELPALCLVEAAARLIPGALGHQRSALEDSFQEPDLLDHPHYTRPRSWRGMEVPEVLFSGDHARIMAWRRERAQERTHNRRPDLAPDPNRTPSPSESDLDR